MRGVNAAEEQPVSAKVQITFWDASGTRLMAQFVSHEEGAKVEDLAPKAAEWMHRHFGRNEGR